MKHVLVWLLVAAPFIAVLVLIQRSRLGPAGSTVFTLAISALLAAACFFIGVATSFGESFVSGIDESRSGVYFALTALLTIVFVVSSLGKGKKSRKAD